MFANELIGLLRDFLPRVLELPSHKSDHGGLVLDLLEELIERLDCLTDDDVAAIEATSLPFSFSCSRMLFFVMSLALKWD